MSLSERTATGLRTARLSPRSFAAIVGCHWTTIYRVIRQEEPNLQALTGIALEKKVARLEELIEAAKLPFDHKMPRKQAAEELQRLFADEQN
jgi:hypothetical protein